MSELLQLAVDAHGGAQRWAQLSRFRAAGSITWAIWAMKGKPGLLDGVVLEGEPRDHRLKITPFPQQARYSTWEPYRQTIESSEGALADDRRDPAASFAGLIGQSPWDDFRVAYFASEANWNYFVAPFLLSRSDFITEEIAPWHEDGQEWRSLQSTTPPSTASSTGSWSLPAAASTSATPTAPPSATRSPSPLTSPASASPDAEGNY